MGATFGGGGSIMTIVWETLESSKIKLERLRPLSLSRVLVSCESPRWEGKKKHFFSGFGTGIFGILPFQGTYLGKG